MIRLFRQTPPPMPSGSRRVCLVCGQEIAPLSEAEAAGIVAVLATRHGFPTGRGFVHPACTSGEAVLDLTGAPDHGGDLPDRAYPAFPQGYDAAEQGRKFDAALREEAAREDQTKSP